MAVSRPRSRRKSVALVFCCTLLGAAAQILMKTGSQHVTHGLIGVLIGIFTNLKLFLGYALYGVSTLLLVLALKDAELSMMYPIIALTYVWVTVLSVVFLTEHLNLYKVVGISIIVIGVAVLGKGGKG